MLVAGKEQVEGIPFPGGGQVLKEAWKVCGTEIKGWLR